MSERQISMAMSTIMIHSSVVDCGAESVVVVG